MPRTTEQFEEIRETRKQQIMDVALKLFAAKGYDSTSISLISKKANISKGLLYNYFNSKEDLLIQLVNDGFEDMIDSFDVNKDGVLTSEEFKHFINKVFDLMESKLTFYKLYYSLILQPSVWKVFEVKFADVIGSIMNTLTEYYRSKGSTDPEAEAMMVGSLLDGVGFNYILNPELYPLERVKQLIINRFV